MVLFKTSFYTCLLNTLRDTLRIIIVYEKTLKMLNNVAKKNRIKLLKHSNTIFLFSKQLLFFDNQKIIIH